MRAMLFSLFFAAAPSLAQQTITPAHCAYPTGNTSHNIAGGTSPNGRRMGGDKCFHRCAKAVVIQPLYNSSVPQGEPISFTVQLGELLGGAKQPADGPTKLCYAGGNIDFGDGGKKSLHTTGFINPCNHQQTGYLDEPINESFTHTFPVEDAPEATYCVSVNIFGDFAYSSSDGSCSYECNLSVSMPITVSKNAKVTKGNAAK